MKIDGKRNLFTLTVEEFIELSKKITVDYSSFFKKEEPKEKAQGDIIYIEDVAALTGYKASTIYSKVCRCEIPTISSGRPLTFSKEEIIKWMKLGRPSLAEMKSIEIMSNQTKRK